MLRILLISPANAPQADRTLTYSFLDHDTTVTQRSVTYPSLPARGAADWALADLAVIAAAQNAENEGYDAVCLGDFGDYGASALRSLLNIPVITAGRSSMLHALSLAGNFGILSDDVSAKRIKKIVTEYGLKDHCLGVVDSKTQQSPDLWIDASSSTCETINDRPCISPVPLILKLAESLCGLGLSHSRQAYPEPQLRKPDLINAMVSA